MLKQTISYTDFDDNVQQETLYFNLTKSEIAENLHLKEELEDIQERFSGELRELEVEDVQRILNLVKTLMRLSYGVRSNDGKRFVKTPELWTEFTQTAAYDEFLYSLFQDQSKAIGFMTGILPKELRGGVAEAIEKADLGSDIARQLSTQTSAAPAPEGVTTKEKPAYMREERKPTTAEFLAMSQEELAEASAWIAEKGLE